MDKKSYVKLSNVKLINNEGNELFKPHHEKHYEIDLNKEIVTNFSFDINFQTYCYLSKITFINPIENKKCTVKIITYDFNENKIVLVDNKEISYPETEFVVERDFCKALSIKFYPTETGFICKNITVFDKNLKIKGLSLFNKNNLLFKISKFNPYIIKNLDLNGKKIENCHKESDVAILDDLLKLFANPLIVCKNGFFEDSKPVPVMNIAPFFLDKDNHRLILSDLNNEGSLIWEINSPLNLEISFIYMIDLNKDIDYKDEISLLLKFDDANNENSFSLKFDFSKRLIYFNVNQDYQIVVAFNDFLKSETPYIFSININLNCYIKILDNNTNEEKFKFKFDIPFDYQPNPCKNMGLYFKDTGKEVNDVYLKGISVIRSNTYGFLDTSKKFIKY